MTLQLINCQLISNRALPSAESNVRRSALPQSNHFKKSRECSYPLPLTSHFHFHPPDFLALPAGCMPCVCDCALFLFSFSFFLLFSSLSNGHHSFSPFSLVVKSLFAPPTPNSRVCRPPETRKMEEAREGSIGPLHCIYHPFKNPNDSRIWKGYYVMISSEGPTITAFCVPSQFIPFLGVGQKAIYENDEFLCNICKHSWKNVFFLKKRKRMNQTERKDLYIVAQYVMCYEKQRPQSEILRGLFNPMEFQLREH